MLLKAVLINAPSLVRVVLNSFQPLFPALKRVFNFALLFQEDFWYFKDTWEVNRPHPVFQILVSVVQGSTLLGAPINKLVHNIDPTNFVILFHDNLFEIFNLLILGQLCLLHPFFRIGEITFSYLNWNLHCFIFCFLNINDSKGLEV